MFSVSKYQETIDAESNNLAGESYNSLIDSKINQCKIQHNMLKKELCRIDKVLKENKHFRNFIAEIGLLVQAPNKEIFAVTEDNIIGLNDDVTEMHQLLYTKYIVTNSFYKKVCDKLPQVWPQEDADKYKDLISEGLLNIFKQYLTMKDGVQEKLFSSLTKTEEKALIFVLETIGEEGNISISEAINKSGISRPVFTSLFDKLDRYKGAEIKNQGVKGTYINFYDHVLSKFEIS
jgi:hypothetical protein